MAATPATTESSQKLKSDIERSLEELKGSGETISGALAPHSIYMVSEPSLRWIGERAREAGLPVHIHISETEQEVD